MKKRLDEIQIARAIAIIAVLFVHSTSTGITELSTDSRLYPFYTTLNSFGKLGVPVFFMLSALVLFYSYYPKEFTFQTMKSFYMKRMKYIFIPYLSFSIIYFCVKWIIYYDYPSLSFAAREFWDLFILGKAHPHLYFLYVLIQFYLLFPIIMFFFKRYKKSIPYFVVIGILIQWGWVYINKMYLQVPYKGSIFLSYMSFFTLGAVWGVYYTQLKEWFLQHSKQFKTTFVSIAILVFISSLYAISKYDFLVWTNQFYTYKENLPPFINSYLAEFLWASYGYISCITIVIFSAALLHLNYKKLNTFFLNLASVSFGIYLIHPLFLTVLRQVSFTTPLGFHLWQIATFFIMFSVSWFVTKLLMKKTKYTWILIGK